MSQSPSSFVLVVTLLPALLSAHHATETHASAARTTSTAFVARVAAGAPGAQGPCARIHRSRAIVARAARTRRATSPASRRRAEIMVPWTRIETSIGKRAPTAASAAGEEAYRYCLALGNP